MKIIQTYWSSPAKLNSPDDKNGRNNGGWLSEYYHACSWALSNLKFRQFYPHMELYTDTNGYDWLVNKLGLKYTKVHLSLDNFDTYHPTLWALPKIHTYSLQNEPFIHVDGDVYIWEKFNSELENGQLLVQNFEGETPYYKMAIEQIKENFSYLPDLLKEQIYNDHPFTAVNAGIIGGQDYKFFKEYATVAMDFIDRNKNHLSKIDIGMFNPIFEQLIFFLLAEEKRISITPFSKGIKKNFAEFLTINDVPLFTKYIHTIGGNKRLEYMCNEIEARLKYEFPKEYNHIKDIYHPIGQGNEQNSQKIVIKELDLYRNYDNTRRLLKNKGISIHDVPVKKIEDYMNEILNQDNIDPEHHLLIDIYQMESATNTILNNKNNKTIPQPNDLIKKRFNITYNNSKKSLLKRAYKLNRENCIILFQYHNFDDAINQDYLAQVISGKKDDFLSHSPQLMLVKWFNNRIMYQVLKSWDILLYYFEDSPITGDHIIEMINTGQTPCQFESNDIDKDIIHFLTKNLLYFNHLEMVNI
ncbi:DUF6734 family protein [Labilibaculum euxinus]